MQLFIITIITTILILLLILAIIQGWENLGITSGLLLLIGGLIMWLGVGTVNTVRVVVKIVPKEKYEILVGEDKVIITNLYSKLTETFTDAATYNIIKDKRDICYLEITEYNMYGFDTGTKIEVKDKRFISR